MTTSFQISNSSAAAVRRGHPWVYTEQGLASIPGDVVELRDRQGGYLGWGLADRGAIAVRVLGRGKVEEIPRFLADRIARAERFRGRMLPEQTDAYRVVSGAGDGLPGLVIDRYASVAVLRLYSAAWVPWIDAIVSTLARLSWVDTVYRRLGVHIVDGSSGGELLFGVEPADVIVIHEDGLKQIVRVKIGQKTGLFLDQREHRMLVRRFAAGRMVANAFSYTGGFSLAAVAGGAAMVTTVDSAAEAIEDAKENFRINGIDPEAHRFDVADVFSWDPPKPIDFFVIDPPSLTHKKADDVAAKRAYRKLHRRFGRSVVRDGLMGTSSCSARLSMEDWQSAVVEGLSGSGDWSWHWSSQEPPDHPVSLAHREARYLKFALLRKR